MCSVLVWLENHAHAHAHGWRSTAATTWVRTFLHSVLTTQLFLEEPPPLPRLSKGNLFCFFFVKKDPPDLTFRDTKDQSAPGFVPSDQKIYRMMQVGLIKMPCRRGLTVPWAVVVHPVLFWEFALTRPWTENGCWRRLPRSSTLVCVCVCFAVRECWKSVNRHRFRAGSF